MTSRVDSELNELLELGDRIIGMATKGGATVAECLLRSGAEVSARVRFGKSSFVEAAARRSAHLRVMKGKQVATTSTSDLTDGGIQRCVSDALELVELAQEDPFAGPADEALMHPSRAPDLDLYDPKGGGVDAAQAMAMAKIGEQAAWDFDPRISDSEGATFSLRRRPRTMERFGRFATGISAAANAIL